LSRLAQGRASYANLIAEVKSRSAILDGAERELAEAEAARDSAVSTNLITRLDAPIVSDRPLGPGRTTLAGLCAIAGLVFGLGIVFAITPIDMGATYGRRSLDRASGRRAADSTIPAVPENLVIKPASESPSPTIATSHDIKTEVPSRSVASVESILIPETLGTAEHSPMSEILKRMPERTSERRTRLNLDLPKSEAIVAPLSTPAQAAASSTKEPSASQAQPSEPIETESIDRAFRELAALKTLKPENRSEELAIQMKVQELKSVLSSAGHGSDTESINQRQQWVKPRPSNRS
jgi:hypothetical protein